jgi:hypothetical protein
MARESKFLIRDDGVVYAFTDALALNSKFRLYDGPVPCTPEEGKEWLFGATSKRRVQVTSDTHTFDVSSATKAELVEFAMDEYGVTLDEKAPAATLRKQVVELAQKFDGADGE